VLYRCLTGPAEHLQSTCSCKKKNCIVTAVHCDLQSTCSCYLTVTPLIVYKNYG
jgi:hypothetical protein